MTGHSGRAGTPGGDREPRESPDHVYRLGNEQGDKLHVQDQIPANGPSIVAMDSTQLRLGAVHEMDIWYPVGAQPDLRFSNWILLEHS